LVDEKTENSGVIEVQDLAVNEIMDGKEGNRISENVDKTVKIPSRIF
jgi:hypothetical protein